jgi:hypothetical protein
MVLALLICFSLGLQRKRGGAKTATASELDCLMRSGGSLGPAGFSAGPNRLFCWGCAAWLQWAGKRVGVLPSTCYAQGRTRLGHCVWRGHWKLLVWARPGSEGDAFACQRKGACRWRRLGPVGPVSWTDERARRGLVGLLGQ